MRQTKSAPVEQCDANCGRAPRPDENPDDDWRAVSDGVGELHVFCPECWRREFGQEAVGSAEGWEALLVDLDDDGQDEVGELLLPDVREA